MTSEAILTLNAGSSSIKFALYERADTLPERAAISGQIDGLGAATRLVAHDADGGLLDDIELALSGADGDAQHHAALEQLLAWLGAHDRAFRLAGRGPPRRAWR